MNREMKFRVWDNVDYMSTPFTLADLQAGNIQFTSGCEVIRYTGLQAKNRKRNVESEIYEGDLFRGTEETDLGDIVKYFVVMWIPQRAAFYMVSADHYDVLRDNDVSKEPEFSWLFDDAALYDFSHDISLTKVGNVYQHKHLLS